MKVKCFGCDASIEADGADDVVEAFVVHGQERHTWSYPEEALRNYARNYAEANERLTGGIERLPEVGRDGPSDERGPRWRLAPVLRSRSLFPATPIGPRAIASNPTCRRRPSYLSAHGARRGQPVVRGGLQFLSICTGLAQAETHCLLALVFLAPRLAERPRPAAKPAKCKGALTKPSVAASSGAAKPPLQPASAPAAAGHPARSARDRGVVLMIIRISA